MGEYDSIKLAEITKAETEEPLPAEVLAIIESCPDSVPETTKKDLVRYGKFCLKQYDESKTSLEQIQRDTLYDNLKALRSSDVDNIMDRLEIFGLENPTTQSEELQREAA